MNEDDIKFAASLFDPKWYRYKVECLIKWARSYYKFGTPEVSDQEWDMAYETVRRFEEDNPDLVIPESPIGKVGYAMFGETGSVPHNPPMLSLSNAMNVPAAIAKIANIAKEHDTKYFVELKADGIACRLSYVNGELVSASTRGDGRAGEDITHLVIKGLAKGYPLKLIGDPVTITVDGELVIKFADFDALNDARELHNRKRCRNTRNAVAGLSTTIAAKPYELRALSFIAYGTSAVVPNSDSYRLTRELLNTLGFEVIHGAQFEKSSEFENFENVVRLSRDSKPYMIDGLVVKVDSLKARSILGENNDSPKWAFSYKFPPMAKWTVSTSTGFTVGRTGQITAMVYFEGVDLGGVTVTKSSVDSYQRWKDLSICIGDEVLVSRRADVRPYVEDVRDKYNIPDNKRIPIAFTATCPVCTKLLQINGGKVFCVNDDCPGIRVAKIEYAFDKEILNVEDFSRTMASTLYSAGFHNVPSIYMTSVERLKELGFLESSAKRIMASIDASRNTDMWRVMASLGVLTVGKTISKLACNYIIVKHGNTIDELVRVLNSETLIDELPIGVAAKKYLKLAWFKTSYLEELDNLRRCGFVFKEGGPLVGQAFCLTGAFIHKFTRSQITTWLKDLGADIKDSASAGVTLITDDPVTSDKPSKKLATALKNGNTIIDSQTAMEMIIRARF